LKGDGIALNHIEQLCNDVLQKLSSILKAEIDSLSEIDPLLKEIDDHKVFSENQIRHFVGRKDEIKAIVTYVNSKTDHNPICILGDSGVGKSALIARAIKEIEKLFPQKVIIRRFIGTTPKSSDISSLLSSIYQQLSQIYGIENDNYQIDYISLIQKLPEILEYATEDKPLVIFIDALNQLSNKDNTPILSWLPFVLPPYVKIIVTELNENDLQTAFTQPLNEKHIIQLDAMDKSDGDLLLDHWLKDSGRTLTRHQRQLILENYVLNGLPLYLKLAFEECRRWKSYDKAVKIKKDIKGLILSFLDQLSEESNHGKIFVSRCLRYLATARHGLSEDELIDILSTDPHIMEDFRERSPKSPHSKRIPVVIWSRLYHDLKIYLTERSADRTNLIVFFHHQLKKVIIEKYCAGDTKKATHASLAEYFSKQSDWIIYNKKRIPHYRKLSELPFQLSKSEMWQGLEKVLTKFSFIESKCTAGRAYDLVSDYERLGITRINSERPIRTVYSCNGQLKVECPFCHTWNMVSSKKMGYFIDCVYCKSELSTTAFFFNKDNSYIVPNQRQHFIKQKPDGMTASNNYVMSPSSKLLKDFAYFIYSRSHVLNKHPELSFQEAYHWLDGSGPSTLAQKHMQVDKNIAPWLLLENKFSQPAPCLMTLSGDSKLICCFSVHPTGIYIVTSSFPGSIILWDFITGSEINRLDFGENQVMDLCFSPDGHQIAAVDSGGKIFVLDTLSLNIIKKIDGHTREILACTYSPDGKYILTGARDKKLKLWDAESGKKYLSLRGHREAISYCCYSPDGQQILSLSEDHTLKIWNSKNGKEIKTLSGHKGKMTSCCYSPNGENVFLGFQDGALMIWRPSAGDKLVNLTVEDLPIKKIFCSPDGQHIAILFNKQLKIVKTSTGISEFFCHVSDVMTCRFSPNGRYFIFCSEKNLKIYSINVLRADNSKNNYSIDEGVAISYFPDGKRILSGYRCGTIKILSSDGHTIKTIKANDATMSCCCCSTDNNHVAASFVDGTVTLISTLNEVVKCSVNKKIKYNSGFGNIVLIDGTKTTIDDIYFKFMALSCCFSPDGKEVLTGYADGKLRAWNVDNRKLSFSEKVSDTFIDNCSYSPDGRTFATISNLIKNSNVQIWDTQSKENLCAISIGPDRYMNRSELMGVFTHYKFVCSMSYAPHKDEIALALGDGTLRIYDFRKQKKIRTLRGHSESVRSCCYSPDGGKIISGGNDNLIIIWDCQNGTPLYKFVTAGRVKSVAFSNDGSRCLAIDNMGVVYILCLMVGHIYTPYTQIISIGKSNTPAIWCVWCGEKTEPTKDIIDKVLNNSCLVESDSLDSSYFECPKCNKAMKLNSVIVTTSKIKRVNNKLNNLELKKIMTQLGECNLPVRKQNVIENEIMLLIKFGVISRFISFFLGAVTIGLTIWDFLSGHTWWRLLVIFQSLLISIFFMATYRKNMKKASINIGSIYFCDEARDLYDDFMKDLGYQTHKKEIFRELAKLFKGQILVSTALIMNKNLDINLSNAAEYTVVYMDDRAKISGEPGSIIDKFVPDFKAKLEKMKTELSDFLHELRMKL